MIQSEKCGCGRLLRCFAAEDSFTALCLIRWVWLSHLSLVNNTPAIALDIVRSRIEFAQANPAQVHLTTLPPGIGNTWDSTQLWESRTLWEMQG